MYYTGVNDPKAKYVNPKQFQNKHNKEKCFRCAKYGHNDTVRPLIHKGLCYCYIRKNTGKHRGKYQCWLSPEYDPKQDPEKNRK